MRQRYSTAASGGVPPLTQNADSARSTVRARVAPIDTDQTGDAHGGTGLLQRLHLVEERAIGHRHATAQPLVFAPRRDDVALYVTVDIGEVAKHAPVARAVAAANRLD